MGAARSGHREAFEKWFVRYEIERKKRHIPSGKTVPGLPPAPPGPDEVRFIIFNSLQPIGERRAAILCDVHRTTIGRWLDGSVQIPGPAYAMLRFHAEGIPPGCGEAWRGFSFSDDGLTCPDGRTTLSAREIDGLAYQRAYVASLERKIDDLSKKLEDMTRRVKFESANDSFTHPNDPRSKAFSTPKGSS